MPTTYLESTAKLSQDRKFRYSLTRIWAADPSRLLFCLLNPSTADASVEDTTLRQCVFFAQREGFAGLELVNLFALRATHPAALRVNWVESVGPENDRALASSAMLAQKIIVAWGAFNSMGRDQTVLRLLRQYGDIHCLGTTKGGYPQHPCRLAHDTPLQLFIRKIT